MKKQSFFLHVCYISSLMMFSLATISAQDKPLDIFGGISGENWEGHFVDSEDSTYTHVISWEHMLDDKAVVETKSVAELNFEMVTYYYFDWEKDQVSFLSLLNKDLSSTGIVYAEKSKITLEGRTFYQGGSYEFRKSLELQKNGTLLEDFFRKKDGKWVQGHLIEYR